MAAQVVAIPTVRQEEGPSHKGPEQIYWAQFKSQQLIPSPHNAAVTSITTGAEASFAVTTGARVQIYDSRTAKIGKTIARFNVDDTARSGVLRRDGRILLAAGDSGIVQAFDTSSRAILRQWNITDKKRQAIHCVRWSMTELTQFMTCGDDRTVRVWDLTEDEPKWIGRAHEDYVRTGCWLPGQDGMLVTGSYDQTVRLWDSRQTGGPTMSFKLNNAVESVLALTSSSVAAASGSEVAIINLIAGKPDVILRSHQKTVTQLVLTKSGTRLLTAGLDGHVKIHSTENWTITADFKYTAPILSLALITSGSEERHLAVGLQTGVLNLRTRTLVAEKTRNREKEKRMQAMIAGTADEYDKKQKKLLKRKADKNRRLGLDKLDFTGEGVDIIIAGRERTNVKRLKGWQKALHAGEYAKALTIAIPGKARPNDIEVVTLVTALRHRSALKIALADRSEYELLRIVEWVRAALMKPAYTALVTDVLLTILDLYSYRFAEWDQSKFQGKKVVQLLNSIAARVRRGAELAEKAEAVIGMMDLLTGD